MDDLLRLLTLEDANTRVVLLGTSLLGLVAGVVGCFAVLRRRSLIGDAVAHCALPGICAAYLVIGGRSFSAFLFGALVFGILGVLGIVFIRAQTRIKEDAAIGVILTTFFGLGIALQRMIQNQPEGNRAGLDTFIFGKAAAMVTQDVRLIAIVAALALAAVLLFYKEFRLVSFDYEFAASQGRPVVLLDLAMMGLLCVCTVIGLPAVGVVLMAALIIIPGAAARFWTERLHIMLLIAGVIGMAAGVCGTALSAVAVRMPAGPLIVLVAAGLFVLSMLFAPKRGVIADVVRRWRLRRSIGLQNLLRALYEVNEPARAFERPVPFPHLVASRTWQAATVRRLLDRAIRSELVYSRDDIYGLTPAGVAEATRVVRAHRLWETFLIHQADIAPDHVDRDADQIEHVLPAELMARLEQRLRDEGRLPEPVPASPHRPAEGVR